MRPKKKSENPTSSRNKILKAIAGIGGLTGLGILARYIKSILSPPPSFLDYLPETERNEHKNVMDTINEIKNPTDYPRILTTQEAAIMLAIHLSPSPPPTEKIANSTNPMKATAGYLSPNDWMVPFDSGKNTRNNKGKRDLHNGKSVYSTPDSVHSLTTISQKVGSELDEQEPEHRQEVQSDQSISQEQRNPNNTDTSPLTKTSLNETQWENNILDDPKIRVVLNVAMGDDLLGENTYDKYIDNYNKEINELERYKEKIDRDIKNLKLKDNESIKKEKDLLNHFKSRGGNKKLLNSIENAIKNKLANPNPEIKFKENESNNIKNQIDIQKSKLEELSNRKREEKSLYENCKLILKNIENYISTNNHFSYENVDDLSALINYLIDKINRKETDNYGEKFFATNHEVKSDLISVVIYYLESLEYRFQETLLNLNNLDKKIIHDIDNYHTSNNYLDILKANEISSLIQQQKDHDNITTTIPDEFSDEYYSDITLLRAAVYWMMINKSFDINTFDNITIYTILKKYLTDERQYNPMQNGATLPEGYYSFLDFKRREEFDSQREFTTQFNKYKDKYSNYEATMLTKLHLSSLDLGITPTEIVAPPKKSFSFSIDNHIGKINFLELISGDWLLIAFIDGIIKMKKYKQEEINSNDLLKALKEPNGNFEGGHVELARNSPQIVYKRIFPDILIHSYLFSDYEKFWDNFFENRIKIKRDEPISHTNDYDRKFPEEYNAFNVINSFLKEGLDNIANKSKISLDDDSLLHTIATVLIPFYDVIYKEVTDSDYSLDAEDVISIVFDSINVVFTIATLGLSISHQVLTKIAQETARLSINYSGRALLRKVIIKLPSMKLLDARQVSRLLASGIIDLIEPLPIRNILKGAYKGLRKSSLLKKGVQVQNDAINLLESDVIRYSKSLDKWKVPDKWKALDLEFKPMTEGTSDGRFEGIYKLDNIDMQTNYYIKQHGGFWQVRWDNDNRTWRIMNPANSGRFNYAIPVKRDNNGLWIKHSDVGLRGGGARSSKSAPKHMQNIEKSQAENIRNLISEARSRAIIILKDSINKIENNKPETIEKVNNAFDIFLGDHSERIKKNIIEKLKYQASFLEKFSQNDHIVYSGGYDSNKPIMILQTTENSAASSSFQKGEPILTVYADALVDGNERLRYSDDEYKNFISTALIHESYHAINTYTPDIAYPRVEDFSLDISSIAKLSEPKLRGREYNEIMLKEGLTKEELSTKLEFSNKRVLENPDNISYMITLISYIDNNDSLYQKFINDHGKWKENTESPLLWNFGKNIEGKPLVLKNTDLGELRHGNIAPLIEKGLLSGNKIHDIKLKFDYIRNDKVVSAMETANSFSMNDITDDKGNLHGVLSTWKGKDVSSRSSSGPIMGDWGEKYKLNDNISVMDIANGESGTVGIKIPFNEIKEGKPIIISAGELSGCTMIYAVDKDYFYAYHAGQQPGDNNWLTSREGVESIYKSHVALTNKELAEIKNILANTDNGKVLGNNQLIDIFSSYDSSMVTYFGKETSVSGNTRITTANEKVNLFDYNQIKDSSNNPRLGLAYALITKDAGKIKIKAYSEDLSFPPNEKFYKLNGKEVLLLSK
ncbi:cytotoxic necrotizing factor Rho-activating domain-containing protein [Photorhabdus hindustanensis]|uniref:Cytotoxic necrotizing factor Rho-activating domain-containing protein n=1 Tax=Photorhabdus hindustanensis TaxID=2918802 RepID=A0A2S8PXX8_9GAMM|nr:cytotoxic necrotizing factor Rho-activating domain-containing protein [Photorhabdus hindustanensis]PQQ23947.1 hypothetical protein C6H66_17495 [Photorhabdus hindustanensis]